jgi:predicted metal-dependent hydrolase
VARGVASPADPALWRRGLALFAAGDWHEAHECFEALWRAHGRRTPEGRLLQALIQLCAAELKRVAGGAAAARLAARAAGHLDGLPDPLLGIRTPELAARIRAAGRPVAIPLAGAPVDATERLG